VGLLASHMNILRHVAFHECLSFAKSFNQDLYRHVHASVKGYCQDSVSLCNPSWLVIRHVSTAKVTLHQIAYVMIVTIYEFAGMWKEAVSVCLKYIS
jgi:hypothetical protein